ncbi:hypothetical protein GCM10010411_75410 [Actinomadura fulvescens]|uniref:Uncharacterized protein n=1 Tax=Actinomadura fulvescens TaxID=46160 RepID=A0ABP6CSA6_9ACTN
MQVLVAHTNWSKHRTPSVASTLLGAVRVDGPARGVVIPDVPDRPVQVGDVLASAPADRVIPFSIWPKVSIQRPHTGSWHKLLHELRDLEWWVREVAVPILITGTKQVPALPPYLDTAVGYADIQAALDAADPTPAATRIARTLDVQTVRKDLPEILGLYPGAEQHAAALTAWVEGLTDDQVLAKFASLRVSDPRQLDFMAKAMVAEALGGDTSG